MRILHLAGLYGSTTYGKARTTYFTNILNTDQFKLIFEEYLPKTDIIILNLHFGNTNS